MSGPSRTLALALFALALLAARTADACSCGDPGDPQAARDGAAQVFRGKVAAVRPTWGASLPYDLRRALPDGLRPERGLWVDFEVTRVWKGPLDARRRVLTGSGGGDCGLGVAVGGDWLIYAQVDGGVVYANSCSRSARTIEAARDLGELGPGAEPRPGRPPLSLLVPASLLGLGLVLALRRLRAAARAA